MPETPTGYKYNQITGGFSLDPTFFSLKKPNYYSDGGNRITVPATTIRPAKFFIEGKFYKVTSDMYLDCNSLTANTPYYVYAVYNSGIKLVYDTRDPDTGPENYLSGQWSYIGAFATQSGSAVIGEFNSCNGILVSDERIEDENIDGAVDGTNPVLKTFSSMPVNIEKAWFRCEVDGANAGGTNRITAISNIGYESLLAEQSANGHRVVSYGWVPILTSQSVYLRVSSANNTGAGMLMGWQEDPSKWP